jgi:hypothetical protein
MFKSLITFVALLMSAAVLAHHSGAPYDNEKRIEVTGTVVEWQWQNPHAWLRINAKDSTGAEQEWNIEATSPNILMRQGWRRSTLKAGDSVTVLIYPLRDGSPGGSLLGARLADGSELGAPPGSSATGPRAEGQE